MQVGLCDRAYKAINKPREVAHSVTGLLLLRYLLLRKMLLGHLLLGTICYCVIIATIVQKLLRSPNILKVIHDHNQFK